MRFTLPPVIGRGRWWCDTSRRLLFDSLNALLLKSLSLSALYRVSYQNHFLLDTHCTARSTRYPVCNSSTSPGWCRPDHDLPHNAISVLIYVYIIQIWTPPFDKQILWNIGTELIDAIFYTYAVGIELSTLMEGWWSLKECKYMYVRYVWVEKAATATPLPIFFLSFRLQIRNQRTPPPGFLLCLPSSSLLHFDFSLPNPTTS